MSKLKTVVSDTEETVSKDKNKHFFKKAGWNAFKYYYDKGDYTSVAELLICAGLITPAMIPPAKQVLDLFEKRVEYMHYIYSDYVFPKLSIDIINQAVDNMQPIDKIDVEGYKLLKENDIEIYQTSASMPEKIIERFSKNNGIARYIDGYIGNDIKDIDSELVLVKRYVSDKYGKRDILNEACKRSKSRYDQVAMIDDNMHTVKRPFEILQRHGGLPIQIHGKNNKGYASVENFYEAAELIISHV